MPTDEPVAKDRTEKPYQAEAGESAAAVTTIEPVSTPSEPREQVAVQKVPEPPAPPAPPVPSVLERFRTFEGERTVKNLIALFDRSAFGNFSQDPTVAIADGQTVVRVSLSKLSGDKAPNFAFTSARYVSLTNGADGSWLVSVKPDKKVVKASISMLLNDTTQEFPLAVTPKTRVDLIKPGEVTEADFQLFLKDRGTADAPKYDLNGDGKRDYVDDYIFTANYLVQREKAMSKEKSLQKPQAK